MMNWTELGASHTASTLLVLFIPSKDRNDAGIDQEFWVQEALNVLGNLFGGATALPKGRGVWRDDSQNGKLLRDETVIIQCYTSEATINTKAAELLDFLRRLGTEADQGAIGFVIDRNYIEIPFPPKS